MFRRTKIVATVGPACQSEEMLSALVQEGVDVFRLNFSHGDHAAKADVIRIIRDLRSPGQITYADATPDGDGGPAFHTVVIHALRAAREFLQVVERQ